VHPHDTKDGYDIASLADKEKVVAVGEIGLDYFYTNSPREVQIEALKAQIEVALQHDLPIIFHVREAFDDFWPIFDSFEGIRGELHSYTDSQANLQKALDRGLSIGINGISTFTKDEEQKAMFDAVPLDRLLFETDAPFLTPAPLRGKVNEPAMVRIIAEYHAERRGMSVEDIASATTANATQLFAL
jgi:TatD DNase family protein